MSGFALLFDSKEPVTTQDQCFLEFKKWVTHYKGFEATCWDASAQLGAAFKLDTPSSLHQGLTFDPQTESWLLAAGTVVNSLNNPDSGNLQALLANYLKQGNAAFQCLDGQFALLIYNKPANKLLLVSDPLGFVSVFYARRGDRLYAATSALAVAKAVQAPPSEYGIYLFLTTGGVYGQSTLWQSVQRLRPGTILEITPTGQTETVYWSPGVNDVVARLSFSQTVEYVYDLLYRLLVNALQREGKTWADVTGGFDSRLVTMMMYCGGLPFKGNCHGPQDSLDVEISSAIAQKLALDYQHFMLPDDWGIKRCAAFPRALGQGDGHLDLLKLSRVLTDQDKRALQYGTAVWGLGGELWRGFFWRQELLNVGTSPAVNYDRLVDYRIMRPIDETVFNDAGRLKWIREELKALFKSVGDQYSDLPNTVKLDCIYAYKNTAHTGAHISAVMGQQRAIAPLFFKDSVTCAISTNFKWRNHGRLVRVLMEKINPAIAGIETTAGGPALPMRVTNLHKFSPYFVLAAKQLMRKASREFLGKSILPENGDELATYPHTRWRQETLNCLQEQAVLSYSHMHSGRLYNAERLADFLQQAHTKEFNQETFLSRILTVEMALRSVGQSL